MNSGSSFLFPLFRKESSAEWKQVAANIVESKCHRAFLCFQFPEGKKVTVALDGTADSTLDSNLDGRQLKNS